VHAAGDGGVQMRRCPRWRHWQHDWMVRGYWERRGGCGRRCSAEEATETAAG
jgi:hypothetical protein